MSYHLKRFIFGFQNIFVAAPTANKNGGTLMSSLAGGGALKQFVLVLIVSETLEMI